VALQTGSEGGFLYFEMRRSWRTALGSYAAFVANGPGPKCIGKGSPPGFLIWNVCVPNHGP
jgi:hypothetical protein